MTDKLVCKWFVLDINDIRDHGGFSSLLSIKGMIADSNFLDYPRTFEIPVLREPSKCMNIGDRVKLTYYTRESKVKAHPDGTLAFADQGLRYEKLVNDSWELIYEDFPEPLDTT
jgi:hypothetical protein